MFNAMFVIRVGATGKWWRDSGAPTHDSIEDYIPMSAGSWGSPWHNNFYQRREENKPSDVGPDAWFTAQAGRFLAEDRTISWCTAFQGTSPVARAGVIVHEGVHHWGHKQSVSTAHYKGTEIGSPPSYFCPTAGECDVFFFHPRSRQPWGQLWTKQLDSYPYLNHQAYQLQWEFLCDVAVTQAGALDVQSITEAQMSSASVARSRAIGRPGFPYFCTGTKLIPVSIVTP